MAKLTYSTEWYLKTIIIHPVYEIILVFSILVELLLLDLKYFNDFLILMIIFLLPLFQTLVGTGIFRDMHLKVFEISLMEGYFNITFSKSVALLISYIPFFIAELLIMVIFHITSFFVPLVLSSLLAIVISLLLSISSNASFSFTALAIFMFIFPIGVQIYIQNLAQLNQQPDLITSSISYILSPLVAYQYWKLRFIELSPFYGFLLDVIFIIILYVLYLLISMRHQIKP